MGYEGVEFHPNNSAPFADRDRPRPFYAGLSSGELVNLVEEVGLTAISTHAPMASVEQDLDLELEYATALGMHAIVIPAIPLERRNTIEACKETAVELSAFAERCRERGVLLCYHNHKEELDLIDGRYVLDHMMEYRTSDNLKIQLDVGWVKIADVDVAPFITSHADSIGLLHIKDPTGDPDKKFTYLGNGLLDLNEVVDAARQIGSEWLIVEFAGDMGDRMEAARSSLASLTTVLG